MKNKTVCEKHNHFSLLLRLKKCSDSGQQSNIKSNIIILLLL